MRWEPMLRWLLLFLSLSAAALADAQWPAASAPLSPPQVPKPRGRRLRIYLDAGHGAPGNRGASSVFCEDEQEHTLRVARHLATFLEKTGGFDVRLSRTEHGVAPYPERLAAAEAFDADALISLHSDSRGMSHGWSAPDNRWCFRQDSTPGFSVLWSDESAKALNQKRLRLAAALAQRMRETGFTPYSGVDYVGLYDPTPARPGVFVDRHLPGQRIFLLRRPKVPSVIIETHHALDFEEATRWKETRTLDAFAAAVTTALVTTLPLP